ncbi:MAG TPA: glutamine synthetase III [Bacteroidales bacterium]|nr:MAG: Glutamine synthetase [Bacteroidetes bacterium ADurb.Bin139]HOG26120.1 glutamine synthetase III [Bacteroidales bacterium]HOR11925.1 glutamine synthetase III [Bacteroidales bacterium]HOZ19857.1 glutamine synthetase III [Bacteroidales bacterium]HPB77906.1 glutamine synthetase III [Bacteroidales bacterium]
MSSFRHKALSEFSSHKAERFCIENKPVSSFFGQNVFDLKKMKNYLPQEAYDAVLAAVEKKSKIDRSVASHVAEGMRSWAMERGATHYTHWFHPLNETTAEKHEAFIRPYSNGCAIEQFVGDSLIQQEPDASSFPSGGLRNTFEARGYTAWDPGSPAFIMDQTLCIPTIFVSYTGDALDIKTPHLKSLQVLDRAATAVARYFDPATESVNVIYGLEQEYFVVDLALYRARPDLMLCDRTLQGHTAAKDQQLEDHYFGNIPSRVMAFMKDFETEAYKLGVYIKTRHNEVAPNQFEFAPYHEEANLAIDHNQMIMMVMRKLAKKHNLKVIFHEKPYAGINGSGKHCNWSLCTNKGINVLAPGKTPQDNLQFLSFIACTLKAVHQHHYLIMSAVASLSNSYRLGGAEAPPCVLSAFMGSTLDDLLDVIDKGGPRRNKAGERSRLDVVGMVPEIFPDNTDRNRTSPFAFTGDRFEFRAIGASANAASAMLFLNTAVAQQLKLFKTLVDKEIEKGMPLEDALMKIIQKFVRESRDIRFEGNGYSEQWQQEAAKRGLRGIEDVPASTNALLEDKTIALMEEMCVMSRRELEARYEVKNQMYVKKLQIEARVLGDLAINHFVPTAIRHENLLLENVKGLRDVFPAAEYEELVSTQLKALRTTAGYVNELRNLVHLLIEARKKANKEESLHERARQYAAAVMPVMERIRDCADHLEMIVDDELWPLPKYRELLFLR